MQSQAAAPAPRRRISANLRQSNKRRAHFWIATAAKGRLAMTLRCLMREGGDFDGAEGAGFYAGGGGRLVRLCQGNFFRPILPAPVQHDVDRRATAEAKPKGP